LRAKVLSGVLPASISISTSKAFRRLLRKLTRGTSGPGKPVARVSEAHPGGFAWFSTSKAFRRPLRRLMRVTFVATKVTKSAARTSPPGLRPDALRCSRLAGSVELAPVASLPALRHCDGPLAASRSAPPAALTAANVKSHPAPSRPGRFNLSSRTSSGLSLSIETSPLTRDGEQPKSIHARTATVSSPLKGAEKRRGEWIRAAACLSVESASERSEFSGPHSHRASQGTRAKLGRHCGRSIFAYFCCDKSRSHQPAKRAAKRF